MFSPFERQLFQRIGPVTDVASSEILGMVVILRSLLRRNLWHEHDMLHRIASGKYAEFFGFYVQTIQTERCQFDKHLVYSS